MDYNSLKGSTAPIGSLVWLGCFLLLFFGRANAGEKWREAVRDVENDVVVYQRRLSSGYVEFKGITHVKSTLSGCVALIRDVEAMPEWVDRTIKAKVLKWVSDTEVYAYNISRAEWPFQNRDAIVHTLLTQDPDTLTITIKGTGIPDYSGETLYNYKAKENDFVRMKRVESSWRFVPQFDRIVEVTFQGYGDPGGNASVPLLRWLVGLVVWESPYKTLKNMRKIIGRNKYQSAKFDFIIDVRDKYHDG
jgi:hypothetical protein